MCSLLWEVCWDDGVASDSTGESGETAARRAGTLRNHTSQSKNSNIATSLTMVDVFTSSENWIVH